MLRFVNNKQHHLLQGIRHNTTSDRHETSRRIVVRALMPRQTHSNGCGRPTPTPLHSDHLGQSLLPSQASLVSHRSGCVCRRLEWSSLALAVAPRFSWPGSRSDSRLRVFSQERIRQTQGFLTGALVDPVECPAVAAGPPVGPEPAALILCSAIWKVSA